MKKILISITLIFTILLSSCSVNNGRGDVTSETPDTTSAAITDLLTTEPFVSGNVTEDLPPSGQEQFVYTPLSIYTSVCYGILSSEVQRSGLSKFTSTKLTSPADSVIKLGRVEVSADLVETIDRVYFEDMSCYLSKDKKFSYTKFSGNDSFTISSASDSDEPLSEYPYDEITEENLIRHVKEYMSRYINPDDFSDYKYCPETYGKKVSENGSSAHTEASVVVSVDRSSYPYFEPLRYTISYKEFINGVMTENGITCVCDVNGDIKSLEFIDRNLNWRDKAFDERNIQENIDNFLKKYVVEECSWDDWYIEDRKLMKVNGSTTMYVTLKVSATFAGSDYKHLMEVRLYLS